MDLFWRRGRSVALGQLTRAKHCTLASMPQYIHYGQASWLYPYCISVISISLEVLSDVTL